MHLRFWSRASQNSNSTRGRGCSPSSRAWAESLLSTSLTWWDQSMMMVSMACSSELSRDEGILQGGGRGGGCPGRTNGATSPPSPRAGTVPFPAASSQQAPNTRRRHRVWPPVPQISRLGETPSKRRVSSEEPEPRREEEASSRTSYSTWPPAVVSGVARAHAECSVDEPWRTAPCP